MVFDSVLEHEYLIDTIFIIPALNEEKTIGHVVAELKRLFVPAQILVVNDASTDRTPEKAAENGAEVISLPLRLGYWGAIQTGLLYGYRKGFKYFVTLDADGQHLPKEATKILKPLYEKRAEVVVGSFLKRGTLSKKMAWSFFRKLTGITLKDLTSGFRAYSRRAVAILIDPDFLVVDNPDLLILLALKEKNMSFLEVEVEMRPRLEGSSKLFFSTFKILDYMILSSILALSKRKTK